MGHTHQANDGDIAFAAFIETSGLLDAVHYRAACAELADADLTPAAHYVLVGEARGLRPNPYFDPLWYRQKYADDLPPGAGLRHYVEAGEKLGFKPCPVFEPGWYAASYGIDLTRECALAHYLSNRTHNAYAPNRYFDVSAYLRANPDVEQAGLDGFAHWLRFGMRERRGGTPAFDAEFVWSTFLDGDRSANAFERFMDVGADLGWAATRSASKAFNIYEQHRRNCQPGPLFEGLDTPPEGAAPLAKVLAFYLPQFHAVAQNDRWWGAGFTEWRNLSRGLARFTGHYQPRIPRDLGFYDLDSQAVLRRQVDLAKRMKIFGFCFYYYNFDGQRLLEKPLDAFVSDAEIAFPFCLMWANENWTRRWDGREDELLIRQSHRPEDIASWVADVARYMRHPRYIRLSGGRPLLMVYRSDIIPDCATAVAQWRTCFRLEHGLDPLIVMAQTFANVDPRTFAFDGAVEFPPHNLDPGLRGLNGRAGFEVYDPDYRGIALDYREYVDAALAAAAVDYPLVRTGAPSWDNDARTQGGGMAFANSTPQAFRRLMDGLVAQARSLPFFGEPVVCVNAWNEWAEGAYLEPDVHFGYAYLNALARSITQEPWAGGASAA